MLLNYMRVCITLMWICAISVIICCFQCTIFFFISPISNALNTRIMSEFTQVSWFNAVSAVFPKTTIKQSRPAIVVTNHQVDADWWFLWQLARANGGGKNLKIVLKNQLQYIPIVGLGIYFFEFLFLRRSLEQDKDHITNHMQRFVEKKFPYWLFIFPEGTTIHTEYVQKSKKFAQKTNRPELHRVLLPRTEGLKILLESVKSDKPDIFDITMGYEGYSGEVPTYEMGYTRKEDVKIPNAMSLLGGKGSDLVHFHGKKWSFDEVYANPEKWLDERWKEKERRLDSLIHNKTLELKEERGSSSCVVHHSPQSFRPVVTLIVLFLLYMICFPLAVLSAPVYLFLATTFHIILAKPSSKYAKLATTATGCIGLSSSHKLE